VQPSAHTSTHMQMCAWLTAANRHLLHLEIASLARQAACTVHSLPPLWGETCSGMRACCAAHSAAACATLPTGVFQPSPLYRCACPVVQPRRHHSDSEDLNLSRTCSNSQRAAAIVVSGGSLSSPAGARVRTGSVIEWSDAAEGVAQMRCAPTSSAHTRACACGFVCVHARGAGRVCTQQLSGTY
jgi:hypothetical protein